MYEAVYDQIENKYSAPWYLSHRVDLHNSLKALAMQRIGKGTPCSIRLRSKVTTIVSRDDSPA